MGCPDEEAILAFLEARLEVSVVKDLDAHLVDCGACRELVASAASDVFGVRSDRTDATDVRQPLRSAAPSPPPSPAQPPGTPLARGASVGRYVVVDSVGRGEMGEVYAAYDPELNRKIAFKLMHDVGGAAQRTAANRAR